MSYPKDRLVHLVALAGEGSSEKRRALLDEVTALFLERPDAYSDAEREQFGVILGRLARGTGLEERKHLSECLAAVAQAPRALILELANDAPAVAYPVISRSPALNEVDIAAYATTGTPEQKLALCERADLGPEIVETLIENANERMVEALLKNTALGFGRSQFERLVRRASGRKRLQRALLARGDLPVDLMNGMFFTAPGELKMKILGRNAGLDESTLDLPPPAERAEAAQEDAPDEGGLVRLLRKGDRDGFLAAFTRLAGLDGRTTRRILSDRGGEALAVVCRALHFDRATFSSIVLLANAARKQDETDGILDLYERVPVEAAERTMRIWRRCREILADAPSAPRAA